MSCIHYKFRSEKNSKTLTFVGLSISVFELKEEIFDKEKISRRAFDLRLINAETKIVYEDESELLPRSSSVVVQRLPAANQGKLPKISNTRNEGVVHETSNQVQRTSSPDFQNQMELSEDMTEQERLELVKRISTSAYKPENFVKGKSVVRGSPPPYNFCNRCNETGHWMRDCPLIKYRRATGIPWEELMFTTADDPRAYLHKNGSFVKPLMHKLAVERGKKEPPPFMETKTEKEIISPETAEAQVPKEWVCILCDDIIDDAVLISCCGTSFCGNCIQIQLIESEGICPQCGKNGQGVDSLFANYAVRKAVRNFGNHQISTKPQPASLIQGKFDQLASQTCSIPPFPDVAADGHLLSPKGHRNRSKDSIWKSDSQGRSSESRKRTTTTESPSVFFKNEEEEEARDRAEIEREVSKDYGVLEKRYRNNIFP